MDKAQAQAAVGDLARELGMADASLGEAGHCLLAIDDGAVLVHLGYNPSAGAIDLMICLDEVTPSPADVARLMTANFAWVESAGATFALEPQSGALVVARRCNAADIGNSGLRRALEALVEVAETWSKRLANSSAVEPTSRTDIGDHATGMIRA